MHMKIQLAISFRNTTHRIFIITAALIRWSERIKVMLVSLIQISRNYWYLCGNCGNFVETFLLSVPTKLPTHQKVNQKSLIPFSIFNYCFHIYMHSFRKLKYYRLPINIIKFSSGEKYNLSNLEMWFTSKCSWRLRGFDIICQNVTMCYAQWHNQWIFQSLQTSSFSSRQITIFKVTRETY